MKGKRAFTLIELVMVIVILGILAAVAIPTFFNLQNQAKEAACKGALGGLRSGIAIWYAKSATSGSNATWPNLTELTTTSAGVMSGGTIPPNPYQTTNTSAQTVITTTDATGGIASDVGWLYNSSIGKIWGATNDSSTY